jgi:hypothetical protein
MNTVKMEKICKENAYLKIKLPILKNSSNKNKEKTSISNSLVNKKEIKP